MTGHYYKLCMYVCTYVYVASYVPYSAGESLMVEKFGEFGESSVIRQTKAIQIFTYNYYLMAESIHSPNFSSPNAHNSEFAKLSRHQTFPLYGII